MVQVQESESTEGEWSHPLERWQDRIQWKFAIVSWAIALAVTVVVTFAAVLVAILVQGGLSDDDVPIATIVAAFASFLSFFVVLVRRLPKLDHDRFLNSVAVAAIQTAVTLVLGLTSVIVRASVDVSTPFSELGLIAIVPVAASIVACISAASMLPARGPAPHGTQTSEEPTDWQL